MTGGNLFLLYSRYWYFFRFCRYRVLIFCWFLWTSLLPHHSLFRFQTHTQTHTHPSMSHHQHQSFQILSLPPHKTLHNKYKYILRVDQDSEHTHSHTHKLANCSRPATHVSVGYQRGCTCSAVTGTACVSIVAVLSCRLSPHSSYQGPNTAHIATTTRGEATPQQGIVGDQHLSAGSCCHSSLHYGSHHQC